ncbi:hypothetical protein ACFQY7_35825 [Actinomadura luteofluorescens]|uniref:hypothetical protein n=1 Tax=Actinomadura luteofluorescens TaxID=46163 RepID=UPI00363553BA
MGTERNANNVPWSFRAVMAKTDLNPRRVNATDAMTQQLRVGPSDAGVPFRDISRLASHKSTEVTETVYRHQIRPALLAGAEAMDDVFPVAAENV